MENHDALAEPLLPEGSNGNLEEPLLTNSPAEVESSLCPNNETQQENALGLVADPEDPTSPTGEGQEDWNNEFSFREELIELFALGFPLAVSFFCRMGMASTDSSFVGHIEDNKHEPETYLAAAVLSDMCVNVFSVPPLAFNQILNALVGQAMGSNNPKMAGVWLQQSMFWLTITMFPFLICFFYVEKTLLFLDFPQDVAEIAGTYAKYNVIWPIPNGLYQCMRFYFQAQGLPKPAMYNNMVFLFINGILNYLFVFGGPFHWKGLGFIGAAISLSISRTLQSVAYFIYMFLYKKHHKATWPGLSLKHHTASRTKEFLKQSLPNMGTNLFQQCVSQATTILVGRLGERAIAASSVISTITIPWSGTLSATTTMVSSVRVGYHLGKGNGNAAKQTALLVIYFITIVNAIVAIFLISPSLRHKILGIATDDEDVLAQSTVLILPMLVGTYLNVVVGNITSGVFSGMGRPIIATILSFGLELPLSIGCVALYILKFHGNLLGVYWVQAILGGFEAIIVMMIMFSSNWDYWASEARRRQEASSAQS